MKKRLTAVIFCCAISSFLLVNDFFIPKALSIMTRVPEPIIRDAINHNAIVVFLFGSSQERHAFAKGRDTVFGSMPYDTEARLKNGYGLTDREVHRTGSVLSFCSPPSP